MARKVYTEEIKAAAIEQVSRLHTALDYLSPERIEARQIGHSIRVNGIWVRSTSCVNIQVVNCLFPRGLAGHG